MLVEARLGPLKFPTVYDDLKEAVGDQLDTVGAAVVAGERRARPFAINFPIHADADDADPAAIAARMRRQVRSLMENARARMEGLYFAFDVDTELNGWLLVGGADLEYAEGGPAFGEFKLALNDAYRVATQRTHRPARRAEVLDLRLSTSARDHLGTIFSTEYASQPTVSLLHLPAGAYDAVASGRRALDLPLGRLRQALDGPSPFVVDRVDGDVVSYEPVTEGLPEKGGVRVFDRREASTPTHSRLFSNLIPRPSVERALTGYTVGVGGTISRSRKRAKLGIWSVRKVNPGSAAFEGLNYIDSGSRAAVTGGQTYTFSLWVYIESGSNNELTVRLRDYDSGGSQLGFTDATNLDRSAVGIWQLVTITRAMNASAVTAGFQVFDQGAHASVYHVDGPTLVSGSTAASPFHGSLDYAGWNGTPYASTSDLWPDPEVDYGWEQVFGADYPLTIGDVPVLENGLVRLRWTQDAYPAIAVDLFVSGTGYRERGRILLWDSEGGTRHLFDVLLGASVVEWTPERATISVSLSDSPTSATRRAQVFFTLQRGWLGPAVSLYVSRYDGTAPSPNISFHRETTDAWVVWGGGITSNVSSALAGFGPTDGSWVSTDSSVLSLSGQPDPFIASMSDAQGMVVMTVMQKSPTSVVLWRGTHAYSSSRDGFGALAANVSSVHVAIDIGRDGSLHEAESWMNAGGTRTSVADGAASGGNAVNDTQTSAANKTTVLTASDAGVPSLGRYKVWARVRVTTSGDTGSFRFDVSTTAGPITATTTSTTYTWVYLGEVINTTGLSQQMGVVAWRSAGTGTTGVRVDRVAIFPSETRGSTTTTAGASHDALTDLVGARYARTRPIPELVAR